MAKRKKTRTRKTSDRNKTEGGSSGEKIPGSSNRYVERLGCIIRCGFNKNGEPADTPVSNFTARIVADVVTDDGLDVRRVFGVKANVKGREILCDVPSEDFSSMRWVPEKLGPTAVIEAGSGARDHTRAGIQILSDSIPERRLYGHTGWRNVGGVWVFLHGGGAIGASGVETDLKSEALARYTFPAGTGDVRGAMKVSIALFHVADPRVAYPAFAAAYRAPLSHHIPSTVMEHWVGESGAFKSTLAAAILGHYGNFRAKEDLPARWAFTDTILEKVTFLSKDVLLVIDDLNPESVKARREELEKRFSRIIGAVGDMTGRRRATATLKTRLEYFPRGFVISTGEQIPPLPTSRQARILPVPFEKGMVPIEKLTCFQSGVGVLPTAMRGYIEYLQRDFDSLGERLQERFERAREQVRSSSDPHARLAENISHIYLGLDMGMEFAAKVDAITEKEADAHRESGLKVLIELARQHGKSLLDDRPVQAFLSALKEGLSSGKAWLADRGTGKVVMVGDDKPGSEKLGWIDNDGVCVLPKIAFKFATRNLDYKGGITISEQQLKQMLAQDGHICQNESEKGRLEANKWCEGRCQRVLWLGKYSLGGTKGDPEPEEANQEKS